MNFRESISTAAFDKALTYVAENPQKNLIQLLKYFDALGFHQSHPAQSRTLHEVLSDSSSIWNRYIMNLFREIDHEVLKTVLRNFGLNASLLGLRKQKSLSRKFGCHIPWAILIDPTSACNLHCTGCWAAEYGNRLNLSLEQLDLVIRQAKEFGTRLFLFSGGEPLVRKNDVIRLCETHDDCIFIAFTNGTLIDETFADEMLRVKNFFPAISVEGFENETDSRRGEGVFQKVVHAMDILRSKHLLFGISCCATSKNTEIIASQQYFDQMIAWGARFCWFFTYMPVGLDAAPELMVTAQQRAFLYHQIRAFRKTKELFTLDFWNDGEYTDGCIAAGRRYLHINANGDVEPCAFIHYSDSNIHSKTLLEALQSPLFMAYREHQPFCSNHLRPCPLLDNPDMLATMVEESGAHSTDMKDPEDVRDLTGKCFDAAVSWAQTADELWRKSGKPCAAYTCEQFQRVKQSFE